MKMEDDIVAIELRESEIRIITDLLVNHMKQMRDSKNLFSEAETLNKIDTEIQRVFSTHKKLCAAL